MVERSLTADGALPVAVRRDQPRKTLDLRYQPGFGTVAAFAGALKRTEDKKALDTAVKEIARGDELMSELAEAAINVQAADKK